MRLLLVPNAELGQRCDGHTSFVPLGLLSLATVLSRDEGISVRVIDPREIDFTPPCQTAELLLAMDPDVVGFSTMCNTYPHALRTAQIIKHVRPSIAVIFGGPHATVVAQETLDAFGFVDFVLKGECERSIIDCVSLLDKQDRGPADVPGLVFRLNGVATQSRPCYPLLGADDLPDIEYGCLRDLHEFCVIPLDAGRGCPFACSFCTTSVYWARRNRFRRARYLIEKMTSLQETYGINSFALVHDNVTASAERVKDLCEQIISSGLSCEWMCSARPDSMDNELLGLMYKAGCRSIFMGIESGSLRIQNLCRKGVRLDQAAPAIHTALTLRMAVTASFMIGFPYEKFSDVEKTIRMMADINYETGTCCDLQLHLLSPVPGAPLLAEPGVETARDENISDVSQAGECDPTVRSWIDRYGDPIFTSLSHYVTPSVSRRTILNCRLGWITLFSYLRVVALALEEARRADDFLMANVFQDCDAPDGRRDSEADVEWCVRAVRQFLQGSARPWAAAVAAVLEFEAVVYRLWRAGGSCVFSCDYEVSEWAERGVAGAAVVGLPKRCRRMYFIMKDDQGVKIVSLPLKNGGVDSTVVT